MFAKYNIYALLMCKKFCGTKLELSKNDTEICPIVTIVKLLKEGRFRLDIRGKSFTHRAVRC